MGKFEFNLANKTPTELGHMLIDQCKEERFDLDMAAIDKLLDLGARVDITTGKEGKTALIWASCLGHTEVIDKLVQAGANIDYQDGMGRTPYFYAMYFKKEKAVITLLDLGADKSIEDKTGQTAESFSKNFGRQKMVELSERYVPKQPNKGPRV